MIYFQGVIDSKAYEVFCTYNSLDIDRAVFIFPGNYSHHTEESTLYSIKTGGGLAAVAEELGLIGVPTLSLPTTGMEDWYESDFTQAAVANAVCDLSKAVGAGFELILPVREHTNNTYFSNPLANSPFEPSFWGGIQFSPNIPLADYYINNLQVLSTLPLNASPETLDDFFKNIPEDFQFMKDAYNYGSAEHEDDPWFRKVI
ncbi:MAG: hypothetical protein P1U74_10150 [Legionellaceae bacterium]|nr:hypothetical protein [Legionellaceae bacterium]